MIVEEIKNIKSGKRELRKFGLTMGIVLAISGGFTCWRGKDFCLYLFISSILFVFLGLVIPSLLRLFYKFWMSLAVLMSWLMTRIILSILFYLCITPMGLLAKLCNKDFLGRRFDKNSSSSYWIPKEKIKDKTFYEKQF